MLYDGDNIYKMPFLYKKNLFSLATVNFANTWHTL